MWGGPNRKRRTMPLAETGNSKENGGWISHMHFQIILDLFDSNGNFPGVALPSQQKVWKSICSTDVTVSLMDTISYFRVMAMQLTKAVSIISIESSESRKTESTPIIIGIGATSRVRPKLKMRY